MPRSLWLVIPIVLIATPVIVLVAIWLAAIIPWWGLVSGLFIIGLVVLWAAVIYDLFRRADVSAWQVALWVALVVILPVIGTLAYYVTRPSAAEIRYRGEQVA